VLLLWLLLLWLLLLWLLHATAAAACYCCRCRA
jgi:hypothetical protein